MEKTPITAKISDDQRLVTLTEDAYKKLEAELRELRENQEKRTIILTQRLRLEQDIYRDYELERYSRNNLIVHFESRWRGTETRTYDIARDPSVQDQLLSYIKNLLEDAKKEQRAAHTKLDEKVNDFNKEVHNAKKHILEQWEKISKAWLTLHKLPFFLRWFI